MLTLIRRIFPWLHSTKPEAVLWRSTLMFVALDVFFTGLVGAYAYAYQGVLAVLMFIIVQQVCATIGQALAHRIMQSRRLSPLQTQRLGVWSLALTLLAAGALPLTTQYLLVGLCIAGGFARGVMYGARLWMESQLDDAGIRQHYLSMVEGSGILFKVAAPTWSFFVLSLTPRFELIFLSAGLAFCLLLAFTRAGQGPFVSPMAYDLPTLWRQKAYWKSAPYFVIEGAAHALRTALFVSGAMSVVGSLKAYALVEICASLVAAGWLFAQSHTILPGPSLSKLKKFLLLLACAWACLLGALWQPWIFPGFVVLYAVSLPLVNAQKAGVTLGGMIKAQGGVESNLMARSILLGVTRIFTLAIFVAAYLVGSSTNALLVAMALTAICLLPIEYWTSTKLHRLHRPHAA